MEEFYEDEYLDIQFKYEFESRIGEIEGNRYVQDIRASIMEEPTDEMLQELMEDETNESEL